MIIKIISIFIFAKIQIQKSQYLQQGNYPFYHLPPFKNQCFFKDHNKNILPIIIFPGLNDWCGGIDYFIDGLTQHSTNEVYCIEYGKKIDGVFTHMRNLIKKGCENLEEFQDKIQNGMIVMGLSMGGLIARGIVQECKYGKFSKRLITIATPQMGVSKVPTYGDSFLEKVFNRIAIWIIYKNFIQKFLSGANFFRYPWKYDTYIKSDTYIKVLNNEAEIIEKFRKRIKDLDLFVNFAFHKETYLYPAESVHWGYFQMKEPYNLLDYKDTIIYKEDRIGIKHLDEKKKLKFEFLNGFHQNITKLFGYSCSMKLFYYLF